MLINISTILQVARIQYYIVVLPPRFALAIVFLWFGLDKFIIHEFYLNWLQATERVTSILPTQDLSLSIYAIGVVEIVIALLLFTGVKIRSTLIVAVIVMIIILLTAQYPSSFPQDIGLIGVGLMLALSKMNNKNNAKNNNSIDSQSKMSNAIKKYSKSLESNLFIARYSIAAVLFLWALDYIINYTRHIGWLQLSAAISEFLSSVNQVIYLIIAVAAIEIVLALMISIGRIKIITYAYIATTVFFIFAVLALDPPSNNHQTVGLAIITAWLGYLAFTKRMV